MRSPTQLDALALIHFHWKRRDPLNPTWERWFECAGLSWTSSHGQLRFSDEGHAIQAAVAGQGIALLSLALVADELAAGQLVQPFGPTIPGHTYHLVVRAEPPPGGSMRAAADWLRSEVQVS